MKAYKNLTKNELYEIKSELEKEYNNLKEQNLSLDMSRGKPSKEQLDLAEDMLNSLSDKNFIDANFDCRNYGILDGISSAKKLMSSLLDVSVENVIVYGNSSLNIMYDTISRAFTHGILGNTPWAKHEKIKFICIVPGYDRHFAITKCFGIENISVNMLEDGPDMDAVEKLVENDESIKGIWCVPKYSNPTGTTYSEAVVKRFANLKPKAKDFRIYWDNAYIVHDLYEENKDKLINIFDECKKAGNEDLVYEFASTSKISFAGAGISVLATSVNNINDIKKTLQFQTIGHDKLNQLRHVRYFKDKEGIEKHMLKHASILRPKFELIYKILEKELTDLEIATWTKPRGGYFISFDTLNNCAKEVVSKLKDIGVVMTNAGATFPDGIDKQDKNIRIAPSFPSLEELEKAAKALCVCTKLVSVNKLLSNQ